MTIVPGDLDDPRVRALLDHHVTTARAQTAPGSEHALDLSGLKAPDITFWAAWNDDALLAVGALKRLSNDHGEVKHVIDAARKLGMSRVSLETGSWPYFEPARAFYKSHGFAECPPFGQYVADPNSIFMSLDLR